MYNDDQLSYHHQDFIATTINFRRRQLVRAAVGGGLDVWDMRRLEAEFWHSAKCEMIRDAIEIVFQFESFPPLAPLFS